MRKVEQKHLRQVDSKRKEKYLRIREIFKELCPIVFRQHTHGDLYDLGLVESIGKFGSDLAEKLARCVEIILHEHVVLLEQFDVLHDLLVVIFYLEVYLAFKELYHLERVPKTLQNAGLVRCTSVLHLGLFGIIVSLVETVRDLESLEGFTFSCEVAIFRSDCHVYFL